MQWPEPGYNHMPAYQVSGLPYALSDTATATPPYRVQFPYVTKFITIRADGGALDIGFTANGVLGVNHFTLPNNGVITMEVRVKEIYLGGTNTFHIIAGLTGIPTASIPTLTGSYAWSASDPYHTGSNAYANVIVYDGVG
jgi:hypothetical protein